MFFLQILIIRFETKSFDLFLVKFGFCFSCFIYYFQISYLVILIFIFFSPLFNYLNLTYGLFYLFSTWFDPICSFNFFLRTGPPTVVRGKYWVNFSKPIILFFNYRSINFRKHDLPFEDNSNGTRLFSDLLRRRVILINSLRSSVVW